MPKTTPISGVDYPATYRQFTAFFPDDRACREYVDRLRFRDGFSCPGCGALEFFRASDGTRVCKVCKRRTSPTAGTIFHRSHLPLSTWFAAMWFLTSQKNGVPALGMQRVLGLGSYETAWSMLHKLRRAMVRPEREPLEGIVEVDESYVGGVERGVDGRHTGGKAVVVIACELIEPKGLGRIRMMPLQAISQDEVFSFIERSVEKGSLLRTDGWNLYRFVSSLGYDHEAINVKGSGDPAHVAMPGVHRVSSLLKRWLQGTMQYAVSFNHLAYYLDEFTFRFNRRNAKERGLLFYRLAEQAAAIGPYKNSELVGGVTNPYI
ncbi:MAG: IS1595 family transposase [Acidimicrobiales bacterium]